MIRVLFILIIILVSLSVKAQLGDTVQLNKVTVSAKKKLYEQKADRLVINVRNSITSSGSSVLDILERSPGVIVDRQNNVLSMGGKEGVVVMINGKETNMPLSAAVQMLAGMSSANIERIELITAPPSNLSAEGNAGYINIVLVDNTNFGTNGSYSLTAGTGRSRGKVASAAFTINHRKKSVNIYSDLSFTYTKVPMVFTNYRNFEYNGKQYDNDVVSNRFPQVTNITGRLGMDLKVSRKTTVGGLITIYRNKWKMHAGSGAYMFVDDILDTTIKTYNDEINQWKSIGAGLNMQHNFNKAEKLSMSIDYLDYRNRNPIEYANQYYDKKGDWVVDLQMKSDKHTPISIWIGNIDYSGKWGKKVDWQAGLKYSRSGFDNDITVQRLIQNSWTIDDEYSASYVLKEDISAAYAMMSSKIDEKTSVRMGLRYEYTNSVLTTVDKNRLVDRHYGKLFPGFFLSHRINDNNSVNVSFTRRVSRPTFNDLAPFAFFMDPNTFITGNPSLQASFSNAVNVSYTFKKYIVSAAYSNEAGAIARFQMSIDPGTNKQFATHLNLRNLQIVALTFVVLLTPTPWWTIQTNIIGKWQRVDAAYKTRPVSVEQKNFRLTSLQSFKVRKNLSIDLSGFYQSKELNGVLIRKAFGTLDFGIQQKLNKERCKIGFTITDIFNSTRARSYAVLPEEKLEFGRNNLISQRMFKLSWFCNFGNLKLESKKRIDSSEEERKRVE